MKIFYLILKQYICGIGMTLLLVKLITDNETVISLNMKLLYIYIIVNYYINETLSTYVCYNLFIVRL